MRAKWPLIVISLLCVAAYWNTFDVPMVFDDRLTIETNLGVRSLDWPRLSFSGRPLLYWTFALNWAWSGMEVWSYHFLNLILHLVNSLFVFRICVGLGLPIAAATFAGSLFAVHPIQVESVTYISSRSELLSSMFYLAAILLAIRWPIRRSWPLLTLLFIAGMSSKEIVITLPAILFLHHGKNLPRKFWCIAALATSATGWWLLTGPLKTSVTFGNVEYLWTELRVTASYLGLILFPFGLNLDHDVRMSTSFFEFSVIWSLTLIALILCLAKRHGGVVWFGVAWFFITLSATSSIVSIADPMAEHRLYLPLAGMAMAAASLLYRHAEK